MTEIRDTRGRNGAYFPVGFRKLRYLRVKGNRMGKSKVGRYLREYF